MKIIVIGLGVQGKKRCQIAGGDFIASVDPVNADATYKNIMDVPLTAFDAALVCLPDAPKFDVLKYLLENGKHVLVEKPLWTEENEQILLLQTLAQQKNLVCYTAYNHRFEPHFVHMKQLIESKRLGEIYACRLFYGNGTARLVRNSDWRDKGMGVIADLGSHLLDTTQFWFNKMPSDFMPIQVNTFENNAPDHAIVMDRGAFPKLTFEVSLLSWRNHFTCDIFAEKGSAHIESLCKWGPSHFAVRERILPSGRPPEERQILTQDDPTWALEYEHFKGLIINSAKTDLSVDLWIQDTLRNIQYQYTQPVEEAV
ncbi:MAG: oxidoreductase [Coxiella sp. (in: Bacteria)]|nr:MAG: oxidoreductase [Coxiella sp. (in: g-proteobacteria)]